MVADKEVKIIHDQQAEDRMKARNNLITRKTNNGIDSIIAMTRQGVVESWFVSA